MARINSRAKGAAGEREAASWLQDAFKLEHKPERNLEQVRSGGHDLIGLDPFCFEIKRQEAIDMANWWYQAVLAAKAICMERHGNSFGLYTDIHPVVMFRQNRKPWEFLIGATNIIPGVNSGYLHIVRHHVFIAWGNEMIHRQGQEPHRLISV